MSDHKRDWIRWIRVLVDPSEQVRGFSLEGLEFSCQKAEPVEDEMYGTLPGDGHRQRGKFWVVSEEELMRVCPAMEPFAKQADWFFPVEFCDAFIRPAGIAPIQTRDATKAEREEALETFGKVQRQLADK